MFFDRWFKKCESPFFPWEAWVIHVVTIGALFISVLSIVAYAFGITSSIVGLTLVFAFITGWVLKPTSYQSNTEETVHGLRSSLWKFGAIVSCLLLIAFLWISRTEDGMISPWQSVPLLVFAVYALAAFFTIQVARISSNRWSVPILMLFGCATFSVSLIVYRLGYGFDAFLHQAVEQYILEHGILSPKTPMFLGQHVLVVISAWLTRLSVHRIDRILVPACAVFVMMPLLFTAFRSGWMRGLRKPAIGLISLCLIPIGYFTYTVPFNLALICLVLIVSFLPLSDRMRVRWLMTSLAVVALTIHPILGVPAAVIAAYAWMPRVPSWLSSLLIPFGLLASFVLYFRWQGADPSLVSWGRLAESLVALLNLPKELGVGAWYLSLFYALLYLAPLLIGMVSLFGHLRQLKKDTELVRPASILGFSTIGIIVSVLLIPLFFSVPDAYALERYRFSLGLLSVLPYLWLPGFAYAVHEVLMTRTMWKRGMVIALATMLLLGSWYVMHARSGPSLSREDLDTVEFIEGNAHGASYAVLAPQNVAAAALMDFGFEKRVPSRDGMISAYSIAENGMLASYYSRLVSSNERPEEIREEMNTYLDAAYIYLVIPSSIDPEGRIMGRLEPLTLAQYQIGSNRIIKLKAVARVQ